MFKGPAVIRADGSVLQGIDADGISGVVIDGLQMYGFVERAIRPGANGLVTNSYLHHNGRNGLGCGKCDYLIVQNNELAHNGGETELGSGSAGFKTTANFVIVRGNYVHDNIGNGIWFDVDGRNALIENNRVERNTRKGIFYEVSSGPAVIRNNVVLRNNCAVVIAGCSPQSAGSPGGGIAANSSMNVEVYGNVLDGNAVAGINFRDDPREYAPPFYINVHHNQLNGDALLNCRSEWTINCSSNL